MWTTSFKNNSRLWIHEFNNGYTVVTDLDCRENKIMTGERVLSRHSFSENYSIDEHEAFLQRVDNAKKVDKDPTLLHKVLKDLTIGCKTEREYGDNMIFE